MYGFLKRGGIAAPRHKLEGESVYIRPPSKNDAADWAALRTRNRDFLEPWSPSSSLLNLTREGYVRRLEGYRRDWQQDTGYAFFIFLKKDDTLMGGVSLANIVRAAGQMADVGYWLGEAYGNRGYMTQAVELASGFAFETLHLHRLQAGTLPENAASQKVLMKCGFRFEGVARRYIRIAGAWRDHNVYGLLSEDFAKETAAKDA